MRVRMQIDANSDNQIIHFQHFCIETPFGQNATDFFLIQKQIIYPFDFCPDSEFF